MHVTALRAAAGPNTGQAEEENNGAPAERENEQVDYTKAGLLTFFESIDSDEFSDPQKEAIGIIVDRIRNDSAQARQTGIPDLFTRDKVGIRKEMLNLLLSRIPEPYQRASVGLKFLEKWVKASNAQRVFMFLTKEKMQSISAQLTGSRMARNLTFDAMVDKLAKHLEEAGEEAAEEAGEEAGNPPEAQEEAPQAVTIRQEIIEAILKKGFMKRLSGNQKEYCEMGHKLELPIATRWMRDFNVKHQFRDHRVVSIHKAGLVSKRESPWVKDSIDFVAVVKNLTDGTTDLWGVEVKSRQKQSTIAPEKQLQLRLKRNKYELIGSDQVSKYILNPGDRYQVLHHAYTYGFKKVILLIGDESGKVLNGTIIQYNNEIHECYKEVLNEIKDLSLSWAYNGDDAATVTIPDYVLSISNNVQTIGGHETLYGQLKLWKVMFDDPDVLPLPVITRIIPRAHAEWNSTKGGSDTVTKISDEQTLKPPKCYVNLNTMATSRCFTNLLISLFKLLQVFTSKKNLPYPSLLHYRNAAASRFSYKIFLRMVYNVCKKKVRGEPTMIEEEENEVQGNSRRALRSAAINGSRPEPLPEAIKPTFKTPKRGKKEKIEQGKAPAFIIERTHECTGFPYELYCESVSGTGTDRATPRYRCYICKNKTRWQCMKCRFFFCMSGNEAKDRPEEYYSVAEKENKMSDSKTLTKIYRKSCFHKAHAKAIEKEFHAFNNKA